MGLAIRTQGPYHARTDERAGAGKTATPSEGRDGLNGHIPLGRGPIPADAGNGPDKDRYAEAVARHCRATPGLPCKCTEAQPTEAERRPCRSRRRRDAPGNLASAKRERTKTDGSSRGD
jgi:hypothetical protein